MTRLEWGENWGRVIGYWRRKKALSKVKYYVRKIFELE